MVLRVGEAVERKIDRLMAKWRERDARPRVVPPLPKPEREDDKGLPCDNCGIETPADELKRMYGVFMCPWCVEHHEAAQAFFGHKERFVVKK